MSLENLVSVTCPDCGQGQYVPVWNSLNVQVSPEVKADFLAGRINLFECKSCCTQTRLVTPFMYHAMGLKFCVQYYPLDALDDAELFAGLSLDGSSNVDPFGALAVPRETREAMQYVLHPHIVFSMQEAVSYVIFREKLAEFYQKR